MTTKHTSRLSERAMLATFSVAIWEGRRRDKAVEGNVLAGNHADADAGAWWTRMIPPEALKRVVTALNKGRNTHARLTLPWANDGTRILPADAFMLYRQEMREAQVEYEAAVTEFVQQYPIIISQAAKRLGGLYKSEKLPTPYEVGKKFHWEISIAPLPDAADFRVALGDDIEKEVRDSIESQTKVVIEQAMRSLWDRLYEAVSKVAERLDDPDKIIRDSLIHNLKDLCELLPKLNATGDVYLEIMRKEVVRKLTKCKPDDLRKEPTTRSKAAKDAKNIATAMEKFMGGGK